MPYPVTNHRILKFFNSSPFDRKAQQPKNLDLELLASSPSSSCSFCRPLHLFFDTVDKVVRETEEEEEDKASNAADEE